MRIVLDTNALLIALPNKTGNRYRKIMEAFKKEQFTLLITNEILSEYTEILTYFYSHSVANNTVNFILNKENIALVEVHYQWRLIAVDEDDNKFVDCAIAANADYIVTDDKHFNVLRDIPFPNVPCIGTSAF